MSRFFALVLILGLAAPVTAQDAAPRYSQVRIALAERSDLHELARRGVALDHVAVVKGEGGLEAVVVLSEEEVSRLATSGFAYEVEVPDLAAFYRAQPRPTEADMAAARSASGVRGFDFGSMAGYHTFDEVVERLDALAAEYPHLVAEKVSIGTTWEGRDIWMVKLSDNPGVDEDEPEVMYTALHHAREPQSMATVLYFLYYLLENYGSDPEATYLLDNRELYVIPVLNPDGYVFNEATDPGGGGMWRKNRRDNGGGTFGVDLNRNYGFVWGLDNTGSSPNPWSETYRGPAAFSEPEIAAVRDFLIGRGIRAAFNYHSFSDVLLHPWGYDYGLETPDHDAFTAISADMTRVNGYEYGLAADVLYPVNGDSDDYAYGEQDEKGKIFSWTPEVGSPSDGFWPTLGPGGRVERILELAEANRYANLSLAWFAGVYPHAETVSLVETHAAPNGHLDPGEPGALTVTLRNLGLEGMEGVRARVISLDPALPVEAAAFGAPFDLAPQGAVEVGPLAFTLGADAPVGVREGLAIEFEVGAERLVRALGPVAIGTPIAVFEDDASSTSAWHTGTGWALSGLFVSPPSAFTDSPSGTYPDNASNALTLLEPLDLRDGASPRLTFWARWDIERSYDFVQVLASTDGTNWVPLAGRHTRSGSGVGVQEAGEPGYDGTQMAWVEEEVDLGAFEGAPALYLRFLLRSDVSVTSDGFFLDDVAVQTFTNASTVSTEDGHALPREVRLLAAYPNPFRDATLLPFSLPVAGPASLAVYELLGRPVRTVAEGDFSAGHHTLTWDGKDDGGRLVPSGVYLCELRAGDVRAVRRVVVLR